LLKVKDWAVLSVLPARLIDEALTDEWQQQNHAWTIGPSAMVSRTLLKEFYT
jgi:hypothetical protein